MAAKSKTEFTPWLCEYLDSIGLDGDVYGEYIASSLQSLKESSEEERMEIVMEFISGALNAASEDCVTSCQRILKEWDTFTPKNKPTKKKHKKILSVEHQVDQIIKTTSQTSGGVDSSVSSSKQSRHPPALSETERKLMLRQYGYASDEETDEDDEYHTKTSSSATTIGTNLNKITVGKIEKEKRETLKKLHEDKVERDKQSREMQKQKKLERKEKEKQRTQKQERRR